MYGMLHLPASEKMQMGKGVPAKDSALFVLNTNAQEKKFPQKTEYAVRV